MPQITLYFSKKDEDLVELAKLEKIKMSKVFIKALHETLHVKLGITDGMDIKELIADKRVENVKEELRKAELVREEYKK